MKLWTLSAWVLPLFLVSCEEEVSPKEEAIQQEVNKRTETIREELKSDQDRRFTIRVVALCLLAGGSLMGLYQLGGNSRWFSSLGRQEALPLVPERPPERAPSVRRVIESPGHDPNRRRHP